MHLRKWFFAAVAASMALVAGAQSLTVTAPNGGEQWALEAVQAVTWTSQGYSSGVRILLFKDGVKVGEIASSIPAAAGTYSWTVGQCAGSPVQPGSGYKIRLRSQEGELSDFSDAAFTILPKKPATAKVKANAGLNLSIFKPLSIVRPGTGETLIRCQLYEVQWRIQPPVGPRASFELRQGATLVRRLDPVSTADLHMHWKVPEDVPPGRYTLHMSTNSGPAAADSPAFDIVAPQLAIDTPSPGTVLWREQSYTFRYHGRLPPETVMSLDAVGAHGSRTTIGWNQPPDGSIDWVFYTGNFPTMPGQNDVYDVGPGRVILIAAMNGSQLTAECPVEFKTPTITILHPQPSQTNLPVGQYVTVNWTCQGPVGGTVTVGLGRYHDTYIWPGWVLRHKVQVPNTGSYAYLVPDLADPVDLHLAVLGTGNPPPVGSVPVHLIK